MSSEPLMNRMVMPTHAACEGQIFPNVPVILMSTGKTVPFHECLSTVPCWTVIGISLSISFVCVHIYIYAPVYYCIALSDLIFIDSTTAMAMCVYMSDDCHGSTTILSHSSIRTYRIIRIRLTFRSDTCQTCPVQLFLAREMTESSYVGIILFSEHMKLSMMSPKCILEKCVDRTVMSLRESRPEICPCYVETCRSESESIVYCRMNVLSIMYRLVARRAALFRFCYTWSLTNSSQCYARLWYKNARAHFGVVIGFCHAW